MKCWIVSVVSACAVMGAAAAGAMPLLSEVYYDAAGSDDGEVFVEISGTPGTSLAGLVLEGINGSGGAVTAAVGLMGVIPPSGLFVVADGRADGSTSVVGANQIADFDFQNGPDSVLLRDANQTFDAVGYGSFGAGDVFAGEGSPAPDATAGQSVARRFADLDTGDNAADWTAGAPTPGVALLVPEPGAMLSLAIAAVALRRQFRRLT